MKGHTWIWLLSFTLVALFESGCRNNESRYIKQVWNKKLDYSRLLRNQNMTDSLFCYDSTKKVKLVSYIDSLLCTPCLANYMEASSRYIDSIGSPDLAFFCIMRPRPIDEIRASIEDKKISRNIYILFDSMNVFLKTNKIDDFPTQFQAFLLDRNDKVMLVGDPIRVRRVRTLYSSVIPQMVNNDGIYRD